MTVQVANATIIKIKPNSKKTSDNLPGNDDSSKRENEIAVLESQLTASIRLQIENIRAGISQMDSMASETLPRALPTQLSSIVQLCDETDAMISNFNFIKMVSRVHANFQQTRAIFDQFKVLDEQIDRVNELLQNDIQNGALGNLLLIFCRLAQLSTFRDNTMEMVKNSSSSLLYQLKRYFKKLDDLSEAFDSFYWTLPAKLDNLAIEDGKSEDIVKIALVLSRMADSNRSRFFEIIDTAVTKKFSNSSIPAPAVKKQQPTTAAQPALVVDFDKVLDEISFYSNDLLLIRDRLAPKFPPTLGLLDFYLLAYHRNIHRIISQLFKTVKPKDQQSQAPQTTGLTAGQILSVLGWVKTYNEALENQFGIASDELEPNLLDDREPKLISDYVRLSRKKITEWIGNLLISESKYFTERKSLPDADGNDRYFTPATVDLFQIVKQHIDMASSVSSGRLLSDIVVESVKNISSFQKGLVKLLENESVKFFEKPETTVPYFEDYLIMMGNSSLRWIENMQNLSGLMDDLLKPEFLGPAQKQLKTASDGFLTIAKSATKILVDIIMSAIKVCLGQLFGLEWYNDTVIETVVATFEDFFTDYQSHAEEFLMVKLFADVLERTVIVYIEAMRGRNSRLKMTQQTDSNKPTASDLLIRDIQCLQKFFSRFRDPKKVEKALDPFVKLRTLLIASEKMIFLEFFALVKVYPDVPLPLIDELLNKRDDLDKQTLKELIGSIKSKLKEEKHIESTNTSIFSKLKVSQPKSTK